jgi:hypothetical protein
MQNEKVLKEGEMNVVSLSERSRRHLELEYSYNKFPNDETKSALSQLTGLATEEVTKWFETQRQNDLPLWQQVLTPFDRPEGPRLSHSRGRETLGVEESREVFDELDEHGEPMVSPGIRARQLVLRSAEVDPSFPDNSSDDAAFWTNITPSDNNFKVYTEESHSSDEIDDKDESSLPGYMVFTASGERLKKRRRRQFDGRRRMEVAMIRKIGACKDCRMRKVKVSQLPIPIQRI